MLCSIEYGKYEINFSPAPFPVSIHRTTHAKFPTMPESDLDECPFRKLLRSGMQQEGLNYDLT